MIVNYSFAASARTAAVILTLGSTALFAQTPAGAPAPAAPAPAAPAPATATVAPVTPAPAAGTPASPGTTAAAPAAGAATPAAPTPNTAAVGGKADVKEVRGECKNEVMAKGLKGEEKKKAMLECVTKARPDLAAKEQCRFDGRGKNLRGAELKAFIRQCEHKG